MKKIIYLLLLSSFALLTQAQNPDGNYNPYVNGGMISPSPLLPVQANGTGMVSFNIGNTGGDPLEVIAGQQITLTITLSNGVPDNADPVAAISGSSAGLFTWSYSAGTYTAVQNTTMPANSSGTITIAYKVTQNSQTPGSNGFNVNITPAPYQTASNSRDDDAVSSYTYTELKDYGDAPSSYGAADHTIDFENFLGPVVDGEAQNQPSANADGDDLNGQDDEDGVTFPAQMHQGETVNIPVSVSGIGRLNAWIDWNGDGDFLDNGEQVASNVLRSEGVANLVVTIPLTAIITSPTFARFRFSPGNLSSPVGSVTGGEVEDYRVSFLCNPPVPTLSSSDADNIFCAGTSVEFTAGGGTNYNFRLNGTSIQNGTSTTFTSTSITNGQTIDVIVSDATGCSATSQSITNTVNPLPVVTITNPEAVCSPATVNLTNASVTTGSTSGLNFSYWTDPAATIAYPTPAAATAGTYHIKGTVALTGCFNTRPVTVTVNPTPTAPTVSVTDNCDGTSDLSTTATGTLLWSTGATTPAISVNTSGPYTVTTTVSGCTSPTGTGTASPGTTPLPPVVSNAAPVNECPDNTINLTTLVTSTTPTGGAVLYKTTNNPLGTNVSSPTAAGAGTYYIFYRGPGDCYSPGTEVAVTINACPPDLTPTLIVNPNIMHGITSFNVFVRITELNIVNTNGLITVNIPKDPRWALTDGYVPSLTILGSTPLNNSAWTYSSDAINHILTSTNVITAGGFSTFGFRVTFNPGNNRGVYTITSQLVSGAGGETRVNNNADSEKLDYFQE